MDAVLFIYAVFGYINRCGAAKVYSKLRDQFIQPLFYLVALSEIGIPLFLFV